MAAIKPSTGRNEPNKDKLLLMLSEVINLLEEKIEQIQQLQSENNHLKTEWEQAFLRLEQNTITIRMLSDQNEMLENKNNSLITKIITLEAQQRRCPHKHQ